MRVQELRISTEDDIRMVIGAVRASAEPREEILSTVERIIEDVREGGDRALLEINLRLEGVPPGEGALEVPADERRRSWQALDDDERRALLKAESRIRAFCRESMAEDWVREISPGVSVGQVHRPLESAGIYIPGGRFPYPSTVLMTGIPAVEARVGEIVICSPPGEDGGVNPTTLAATHLIDGCRVFKIGGAQAVAAMAFGTETVPACRIVAGPGNIYVQTAKRMLADRVLIDLEAGPSEIAVYADESVDLRYAAADMLAQVEHDPMAVAVLVSESDKVFEAAREALSGLAGKEESGPSESGSITFVRCGTLELAVGFLNELAPEHLEIMVKNADDILESVTSAGCVFLGPYSAVALGDYVAGPSHVLPTGGAAKLISGLSVENFRRTINVISYTKEGFLGDARESRLLASMERLEKHALSLDIRIR